MIHESLEDGFDSLVVVLVAIDSGNDPLWLEKRHELDELLIL